MEPKELGQYYTELQFARLICRSIPLKKPKALVELSAGVGALVQSAIDKWSDLKPVMVEIDKRNVDQLKHMFSPAKIICGDSMKAWSISKVANFNRTFDIAVANPPFLTVEKNDYLENTIVESQLLNNLNSYRFIQTEVYYLAQNLNLLKKNGYLGIVVPEGIIVGQKYRSLRQNLFSKYTVSRIIELPKKAFNSTEADCYILIVKNAEPKKQTTTLSISDRDGWVVDNINVDIETAIERSDYSFNRLVTDNIANDRMALQELNAEVTRGSLSLNEYKKIGIDCFHTTDFRAERLPGEKVDTSRSDLRFAKKGDILIPRVGRRCLQNAFIVKNQKMFYSDCVYRIRANKQHQERIWSTLNSSRWHDTVDKIASGVCAKILTKKDLINIKVF